MKPTIKTQSGLYFDFVNVSLDLINLNDIAHALSHICRFGGHSRKFYSVARHLIECEKYAENIGLKNDDLRDVFCHDFAEAYVGDVCKPLKNLLPEYSQIESRVETAIEEKFSVNLSNPVIKDIDLTLLFAERDVMFDPDDYQWNEHSEKYNYKLELVLTDIQTTRKEFLNTAKRLKIQ